MKRTAAAVLLLGWAMAFAGTLYKSVGPDGTIVYSDQPPEKSKVEKTFNFSNLPATPLPPDVLRYREGLEKGAKERLAARDPQGTVLFTAAWCPYCRQAEAYLAEKKIPYVRNDIDTPSGKRALAESGNSGVPVIYVKGKKVQGFSRPAYDALFASAR